MIIIIKFNVKNILSLFVKEIKLKFKIIEISLKIRIINNDATTIMNILFDVINKVN